MSNNVNVGGWWTERHWRRVSRLVGCQSQLGSCAVFASEWRCDSIIDFDNQYQSVIRTGNSQKRFVRDAVSEWCKLDLFKRLRSTTWRHTRGHNENVENVVNHENLDERGVGLNLDQRDYDTLQRLEYIEVLKTNVVLNVGTHEATRNNHEGEQR